MYLSIFCLLYLVKPVIQLNDEVLSDDDLYSDVEDDKPVNIPMETSYETNVDPDFEVPMTPVPSKRRKASFRNNYAAECTARRITCEYPCPRLH